MNPKLSAADPYAAEAQHGYLPDAAHGRAVDARVGGLHFLAQVNPGRALIEVVSFLVHAQVVGNHAVGAFAER